MKASKFSEAQKAFILKQGADGVSLRWGPPCLGRAKCCVTVLMDSNKCSTQVERLEVVQTGRRRRWTDDEKLRIVLESLQAPRAISSTARRHGISRSLLLIWRRSFEANTIETDLPKPAFVPAMVISETAPPSTSTPAGSRMVIEIGEHRRFIVDAGVNAEALARVLDVLGRR